MPLSNLKVSTALPDSASDRLHYHPLPPNSSQFPMIIPLDSEVDANLEMMNIMMSLASVPSLNNQNYYTADSDMASSGFGNVLWLSGLF